MLYSEDGLYRMRVHWDCNVLIGNQIHKLKGGEEYNLPMGVAYALRNSMVPAAVGVSVAEMEARNGK